MSGPVRGVLALDIGTSSSRAVFFDGTGSALPGGPVLQLPNAWRTSADGAMEADAEVLFTDLARVLDAAAAASLARGVEVAAVATTAFWHSLVGLGDDGAPITPVYAWGDTRAAAAAQRLRGRLDVDEVHRRTGCFLDASYPAARLLWLRESQPDVFARAARWVSFAEYVGYRLFGEFRCSLSMASGTGLFDGWRQQWDDELLDLLGLQAGLLSTLVDTEPYAGPLRPEFARRWPRLARVPWLPALGDGACANFGSGAVGAARPALTLGTTAAMRVLVERTEPAVVPGLWCYRLDRRRFVVGRALSNGGNVVAALERSLRLPPPAEREALLAALPPDGHGLTVLPWLVGERGPGAPATPGAAVVGQSHATAPIEVLQAWMEAVAFRIAGIAGALESGLGEPEVVVAGGGAFNASPTWMRIVADALGRTVALSAAAETSARGAALVALERLGHFEAPAPGPPAGPVAISPDAARTAVYRSAIERQRRLAETVAASTWLRPAPPSDTAA